MQERADFSRWQRPPSRVTDARNAKPGAAFASRRWCGHARCNTQGMETIIVAGRFDTFEQAQATVQRLVAAGFRYEDADAFFVNPPGQHAQFPIGGDEYSDEQAAKASPGAIAGAAAGGALGLAAALAVPGLNVALALGVIGVGAYTGSLAGTLAKLGKPEQAKDGDDTKRARSPGVLVAVRVLNEPAEKLALEILREAGAADVERRLGVWQDGAWIDFDPVTPPRAADDE